jgi:hypothetical protein
MDTLRIKQSNVPGLRRIFDDKLQPRKVEWKPKYSGVYRIG